MHKVVQAVAGVAPTPGRHRLLPGALVLAVTVLVVLCFFDGLAHVAQQWRREEYSYGYVIWPITAWLVWNRCHDLPRERFRPSWLGPVVVLSALLVAALGQIAGMPALVYYGFVICCYGLFLGVLDRQGFLLLLAPLSYLWFGFPLPSTLYTEVAVFMQLISSEIGTALIRVLGIPVLLEGNVIDLGVYRLQVAEACSGLRYLFPIASFAYIVAYTYNGPLWHKALILLSTAPITIVINSFRIAVTGVLVHHAGIAQAEGFMHWFEGYVIALAGLSLLYVVVWLLLRLAGKTDGVWPHIRFELFWPVRPLGSFALADVSRPFLVSVAMIALAAALWNIVPERAAVAPERHALVTFPMQVGEWRGDEQRLGPDTLRILKLDDYLLADYRQPGVVAPVELYIAYYKSQDNTAAIHSPGVCIPAGGWEIAAFDRADVPGIIPGPNASAEALTVNRTVISKGLERRVVYYWFEQRGRRLTNEYAIKATNALDALTRKRTDGALVRVDTPIVSWESPDAADARLAAFLKEAYPLLKPHIPD